MSDTELLALFLPYGLAFFVLGMIALIIRRTRHTPIPLIAELPWLAGFGIIHGAAEWHTIFVRMSAFSTPFLGYWILLALNIVSFWFLLRFGVGLLIGYGRATRRTLHIVNAVGAVWAVLLFVSAFWSGIADDDLAVLDVLSRYTLGLSAPLTTAAGLHSAADSLRAFKVPHRIIHALFVMVGCFVVYGISTGIVVPVASFVPASLVNEDSFRQFLGFPVQVLRALSAGIAAGAFFLVSDDIRQAREQRLVRLRELSLRTQERERLGHDLHDQVIQTLFAAGLRLESVAERLISQDNDTIKAGVPELTLVRGLVNEAIQSIRDFISTPIEEQHALRPTEFLILLADHCERLRERFKASIVLQTSAHGRKALIETPDEWFAILEEAVANAVRHAGRTHVQVRFGVTATQAHLIVTNDGKATEIDTVELGTGIESMRQRARRLGGELMIRGVSKSNTTVVELVVPL